MSRIVAVIVTVVCIGGGCVVAQQPPPAAGSRDDLKEQKLLGLFRSMAPEIVWPPAPSARAKPATGDDELRQLLKARYQCARVVADVRLRMLQVQAREETIELVFDFFQRAAESELALCDKPEDRIPIYTQLLAYAKVVEGVNKSRFVAGRLAPQDYEHSRYLRADAAIRLIEAKRKLAAKDGTK